MTLKAFQDWLALPSTQRSPLVMGILNVTPDSFSDGDLWSLHPEAIAHGLNLQDAGADIVDVGGESTRPGAQPVPAEEQCRRVLTVIHDIHTRSPHLPLSIDTTSAIVAEQAIAAGARLINDVSAGLDDPETLPLAARLHVPIILMHRPASSATMQDDPRYEDVVDHVCGFLRQRIEAAISAGITREMILLDPGIGFGKTTQHDLALLNAIPRMKSLGQPIVIGVSRKKFIGQLTGETDPKQRVFGTAAAVSWSVANGADIVRVHDVSAMVQVVTVGKEFRAQSVKEK